MPTPNYILDPRFELQMVAAKVMDLNPHGISPGAARAALTSRFNPTQPTNTRSSTVQTSDMALAVRSRYQTTTVTFNSLFDNSILAWRYGFVPHTMLDAMGMARALLGHELTSFSLKNIADFPAPGLPRAPRCQHEGQAACADHGRGAVAGVLQYAMQDNYLCEQIFLRLYPQFPWSERR
jgi:hypothetical protein